MLLLKTNIISLKFHHQLHHQLKIHHQKLHHHHRHPRHPHRHKKEIENSMLQVVDKYDVPEDVFKYILEYN